MLSELLKSIWIEFHNEVTDIYVVNTEEISCRDMRAAYCLMSESRRKKCDGLRREEDKRLCIAADMLLRTVLCGITGIAPEALCFAENEKGKPYCENADVNFSISHSGKLVAVCVDKIRRVGIDIEKIRPVKASLMHFFCNDEELEFISGSSVSADGKLTHPDVLDRFFRVWTFKEAAVKLSGEGITDEIKNVLFEEKKCFSVIVDGYRLTVVAR